MLEIIIIIVSLSLSFYFAGTETAFISVNRVRIELWRRQKRRGSEIIRQFLLKPERFIYTTLVGNNISNVAFASYATLYFDRHFSREVAWIIITVLSVVIGEIIPKTLFRSLADWVILRVGPLLHGFYYLLFPMIWIVNRISELVLRMFHIRSEEVRHFFSRKDVEILIRESEKKVNVPQEEGEILRRILQLRHVKIRDVMVPRTEIVAISENASLKELVKLMEDSGFTRIPVYRKNLDDIIGVVFLKDLFKNPESLKSIIREVMFVPETKNCSDLLREFREHNMSLAIVVDEYGGTAGLVTIEDLIEELVGEIEDEFDETEIQIRKIDDYTYRVNARIELDELCRALNIELPSGDYETLAGFIFSQLGHIPRKDESFEYNGIRFTVTKSTRRKLEWVKMELPHS